MQSSPTTAVSPETSIDDLLARCPAAALVFVRRGMHCVGCPLAGFDSLQDACREHHQPLDGVLADLAQAARRERQPI